MGEILDVTFLVVDAFERLGIPYLVGGSLASPPRTLAVAIPEDVIAHKLYWYRLGDEVSERQWSDAMGVLRVAGDRLDLEYLHRAATLFGVGDLLDRALDEAQ